MVQPTLTGVECKTFARTMETDGRVTGRAPVHQRIQPFRHLNKRCIEHVKLTYVCYQVECPILGAIIYLQRRLNKPRKDIQKLNYGTVGDPPLQTEMETPKATLRLRRLHDLLNYRRPQL